MNASLARSSLFLALGSFAFGVGAVAGGCAVESSTSEALAAPPPAHADPQALRVLVTGFNDWKELGDPPKLWRCRENPSCRLLLGAPTDEKPTRVEGGPLVDRLRTHERSASGRAIDWTFETLPVTWQVSEAVDIQDYDLVLHLGLGVYDRFDQLLVEHGAYNQRKGKDAAGSERDEKIDPDAGEIKMPAPASSIDAALDAVEGKRFAGYQVDIAAARTKNSYLCNETHFRALVELDTSLAKGGRLKRVHFVHIPYAKDDDYDALAAGVGGLLEALVDRE